MCSLTESALDPEMRRREAVVGREVRCKKCGVEECSVSLRVRDTYCRECFLTAVHHKVRATLGKHKATRPGERVVVAASGGMSSTALLHILQQGFSTDTKRLLFLPSVLYLEEGAVYGEEEEVRRARVAEVVAVLRVFGFPVHVALLESCNQSAVSPVAEGKELVIDETAAAALAATFAGLRESSARQELLLQLRRAVLVRAAAELGSAKVFTGEHGTGLAVSLLAGVAGGAGGSLAHRTGFRDTRGPVEVDRPMRDVSGKEVAVYAHLHRLATVERRSWATAAEPLASLHRLTEEFLVGLQQDFPATIPTIFKTGDKLVAPQDEGEGCVLCGGNLDTDTSTHCALQATNFSRVVSERGREGMGEGVASVLEERVVEEGGGGCAERVEGGECCGEGDGSCKSGQGRVVVRMEEVVEQLCYSCRRTLAKVRAVEELPVALVREVAVRRRREGMRNEISNFLL